MKALVNPDLLKYAKSFLLIAFHQGITEVALIEKWANSDLVQHVLKQVPTDEVLLDNQSMLKRQFYNHLSPTLAEPVLFQKILPNYNNFVNQIVGFVSCGEDGRNDPDGDKPSEWLAQIIYDLLEPLKNKWNDKAELFSGEFQFQRSGNMVSSKNYKQMVIDTLAPTIMLITYIAFFGIEKLNMNISLSTYAKNIKYAGDQDPVELSVEEADEVFKHMENSPKFVTKFKSALQQVRDSVALSIKSFNATAENTKQLSIELATQDVPDLIISPMIKLAQEIFLNNASKTSSLFTINSIAINIGSVEQKFTERGFKFEDREAWTFLKSAHKKMKEYLDDRKESSVDQILDIQTLKKNAEKSYKIVESAYGNLSVMEAPIVKSKKKDQVIKINEWDGSEPLFNFINHELELLTLQMVVDNQERLKAIYYMLPTKYNRSNFAEAFLQKLGDDKLSSSDFSQIIQKICTRYDKENAPSPLQNNLNFHRAPKQSLSESPTDLMERLLHLARLAFGTTELENSNNMLLVTEKWFKSLRDNDLVNKWVYSDINFDENFDAGRIQTLCESFERFLRKNRMLSSSDRPDRALYSRRVDDNSSDDTKKGPEENQMLSKQRRPAIKFRNRKPEHEVRRLGQPAKASSNEAWDYQYAKAISNLSLNANYDEDSKRLITPLDKIPDRHKQSVYFSPRNYVSDGKKYNQIKAKAYEIASKKISDIKNSYFDRSPNFIRDKFGDVRIRNTKTFNSYNKRNNNNNFNKSKQYGANNRNKYNNNNNQSGMMRSRIYESTNFIRGGKNGYQKANKYRNKDEI